MYKLLVMEDDQVLLETLEEELTAHGYQVCAARHGDEALSYIFKNNYDLYIFDINVPFIDGLTILQELRDSVDFTPAILLTSKNTEQDKITGFKSGCDDYMTKPFSIVELKCRIDAILKRRNVENIIEQDGIKIDLKHNILEIYNKSVMVDKKALEILHLLLSHRNTVISYEEIIEHLYKNKIPSLTVIRVHISKINSLLDKKLIKNIRGIGYIYG